MVHLGKFAKFPFKWIFPPFTVSLYEPHWMLQARIVFILKTAQESNNIKLHWFFWGRGVCMVNKDEDWRALHWPLRFKGSLIITADQLSRVSYFYLKTTLTLRWNIRYLYSSCNIYCSIKLECTKDIVSKQCIQVLYTIQYFI